MGIFLTLNFVGIKTVTLEKPKINFDTFLMRVYLIRMKNELENLIEFISERPIYFSQILNKFTLPRKHYNPRGSKFK